MNNNSNIERLRGIVRDEARPGTERGVAAQLLITELVDAVQMPADDDAEVVARMQPWEDRELAKMMGTGDGESLPVAKSEVFKAHKLRAVLAVVVDETAERYERLAACDWVLQQYGHVRRWSMYNFTADKLLSEVLPPTATRYERLFKPEVPVDRPPRRLQDVWRF